MRKTCKVCGSYLMAIEGDGKAIYCHPEAPCSGTSDAIRLTIEVEDEYLQEIWEKECGKPTLSDYELLNKIWENRLIRFLIEKFIKIRL